MPNSTLIKFADDITWLDYKRRQDNIILNVSKTKELIVDIRKCRNLNDSIIINCSAVE